jgi:hypothetical protein
LIIAVSSGIKYQAMELTINIHHFIHQVDEKSIETKLDKLIQGLPDLIQVAVESAKLSDSTDDLKNTIEQTEANLNKDRVQPPQHSGTN